MPDGFPYVVASDEAVSAGAWFTDLGGGRQPIPEYLPAWDLTSSLSVERMVDVDLPRLRAQTGIDENAGLAVSVAYSTERLDGCLTRIELSGAEGVVPVSIEVTLSGALMSSRVQLVTSLILTGSAGHVAGPVAWRAGSTLWRDSRSVRLHGDATQFPLEVVDFSAHGINPAAPWFLQLAGDLSLPVMGSVQLLVNTRFPHVVDALVHAASREPLHVAIRSSLTADVGRTLVEHLLATDDEHQDWPDDSLGDALRKLAAGNMHGDANYLRGQRDSDASGWSSEAAAAFGLMHGIS